MQLIFFCIVIPILYKIFIDKPIFYQSDKYIGLLATTYALTGILNFYLATIQFTKNTKMLLNIYLITAVCQITITYFGIKSYGLTGAIYAAIISKLIQVVLTIIFTKNIFHYDFNKFKIIGIPFLFVIINIVQYHLVGAYNVYHYLAQLVLFSVIFYLIFKNEIKIVFLQFFKAK
jgi:O-antigen/teichoic acid export membrane protein